MKSLIHLTLFSLSLLVLPNMAISEEINHCRVKPNRSDALDFPNKHAWNLFMMLNHPASNPDISRGEADCSKPIGAIGTTSLWETWRLARTEVFLADGSEPPNWHDLSLPRGGKGAVPEQFIKNSFAAFHQEKLRSSVFFDPEDGVFVDRGGIGETRMNQSTYEFILKNCLYSLDGVKRYAIAFVDGKKPSIIFPEDSIEVKAVWLEFTDEDIQAGKQKRYYVAEEDGKLYGLTSFHLLTKDIPNWFWATFHHKDAPENKFEKFDNYGRPKQLNGTVWENYVLGGTQIDFINSIGKKDVLSDHYIEFGFQESSCITCHANANASADGVPGRGYPGPMQTLNTGIPIPDSFMENGKQIYMQTDFLWSIPFRARAETNAAPSRCVW